MSIRITRIFNGSTNTIIILSTKPNVKFRASIRICPKVCSSGLYKNIVDQDDFIKWKHFPCYWPLCRKFTGHWWILLTKASDRELWFFFYLHLNTRLSKQLWGWRFEMSSRSLWRYCNVQIACRYLQNTEKLANWLCSMKTPHDIILWKWYYQSHLICHHEKSWFLFCLIIMHPILVHKMIQAFDSGGNSQINKYIFLKVYDTFLCTTYVTWYDADNLLESYTTSMLPANSLI